MNPDHFAYVYDIHRRRGRDFFLDDLASALVTNRLLSGNGAKIWAAGFHKVCYETVVVVEPTARPQEKWTALRELNEELSTRAFRQGLDIVHAVTSSIGFDKRLLQLGWKPDLEGSRLWSLETNEIGS